MSEVTVVGGGLAGMAAALRLAERGYRVTIFESSDRLGGKAGASSKNGDWVEHGYHIFPMWYRNVWRLVEELQIAGHFVDCEDFLQLKAGAFPRFTNLKNITSLRYAWHNLTSGLMPLPEMALFYYAAIDLTSRSFDERSALDQISVTGFIRARFYRTERMASLFQDLVLKGISVPSYFVSAMTMRHVMRYWSRSPLPMFRILRGNLQELFISPFEARLRALGCDIRLHHHLERITLEGKRVARLQLRDGTTGEAVEVPVERVVLAVPAEQVAELLDDDLYLASPRLGSVSNLHARPMAALNISLKQSIPGLPACHINLLDSRYGLSFLDVSQFWPGHSSTVLNAIASETAGLETVSDETAVEQILDDFRHYLPGLEPENIARTDFQLHRDAPLFMNDVGAWPFRLDALPDDESDRIGLENLYPAGDHCRSHVDLVSMEGALTTGLRAAEAVRRDAGTGKPVEILTPPVFPRWLLVAARYGLLPVAACARLAALFRHAETPE